MFSRKALGALRAPLYPALPLFIGGMLMGVAPVNAWPLAWVALIPLWQVAYTALDDLQQPRPRRRPQALSRSLMHAAIWGVAYHGTALSWITGLHPLTWMGIPWLGSIAIALFAWAFITLWGAAIGLTWMGLLLALGRWQTKSGRLLPPGVRILVGTALWCAVEWAWSRGPLYWTSLSYTQSPHNLLVLQLGQLAGPIGITAAIVAVNGCLAACLMDKTIGAWRTEWQEKRWQEKIGEIEEKIENRASGWAWQQMGLWAIALFLGLHLLGLGLYLRPLSDAPNQALAVGLVQGNIPTRQKLTIEGIQTSRQAYLDGYNALAQAGADLVLTPEGALPKIWNPFVQERNVFQRAVENQGVPLVLGTFAREDIDDPQTPLTQALLTLTPAGGIAGRYNKVKLVPLGEYIPFQKVLGQVINRLSPIDSTMVPGRFDQVLETPFGPVAAGICYEAAFTELYRQQVARGGEAIFTASNNDPYSTRQMRQHHAQDVMRAVEADRWEVRVTNTGISGLVDPKGRSLWLSTPNEYTTYVAKMYRRQTRTPYVRWGDWLTPLLLLSGAIALFLSRPLSPPSASFSKSRASQSPSSTAD